jgi:predicted ABC-type ATPase
MKAYTLRCCRPQWFGQDDNYHSVAQQRVGCFCTSDPTINVARITQRYLNGGHEVPISKIISRYYKSLVNANKAITFVDRAYIYDNSIDNQLPRLLFRTTDGQLFKQYTDDIPEWAKTLI